MPGVKVSAGLTNFAMAAYPSHPFFELLVSSLPSYNLNYGTPYLTIMGSAGPHMVSFVWREYLKRTAGAIPKQPRVRILMPAEVFGATGELTTDGSRIEDFFTKEKGATWYTWDVMPFFWLRDHVSLTLVLGPTALLLVTILLWVLVWNTALAVRGVLRGSVFSWRRNRGGTRKHEMMNRKYECA